MNTSVTMRRKMLRAIRTFNFIRNSTFLFSILWIFILPIANCRHDHHRHMKFPEGFNNLTESKPKTESDHNGIFVQIPHSSPPTVRPPPYTISHDKCKPQNVRENWIDTLCGDLNTGVVPQNPMGHKFLDGGTYPFETIKNKTLEFFRRALPILKSDKSLPKVAKYAQSGNYALNFPPTEHLYRAKRGIATREGADPNPLLLDASYPDSFYYDDSVVPSALNSRQRRQYSTGGASSGFCENRLRGYYNRLCKLYNAMWGKSPHNIQRDTSGEIRRQHATSLPIPHQPHHHHHHHHSHTPNPKKHFRQAFHTRPDMNVGGTGGNADWTKLSKHLQTGASNNNPSTAELPPTPCPSAAEYLTPVFARNHEGAWRYVVQIPKEGYFTQTVEVTKCLKSTCYYMEGSCKTSPRWQSLLVAELFYPEATFPTTPRTTTTTPLPTPKANPLLADTDNYPDYLYSKGSASIESSGSNYSNELGLPFKKRSIRSTKESKSGSNSQACDGYDDVGCYQVRLFYDWFLIPGSCKCWKSQFDFTLRSNHG